ncbi:hypothetical protein [Streptomyces sp. XD-27]|uniref:hypothetical protein n=1 Tax=Streptomyces sp. XD-27 TaxID=3062779 RepID=UPI0026F40FAB|nr:hypothetical protein [Streptomyces sp. XD-27]WKX70966.1 hypothetical protein Q3Y56_14555 [Streptomyces sp. XD-27]
MKEERRAADIKEHRLDEVFDGDWSAAAGQLLLRWYSDSRHHTRLALLAPGRIVLAAPRKRVWRKPARKMEIVAELPGDQATIEDPLNGRWELRKFRIRFRDGSWLVLTAQTDISEIDVVLRTHSPEEDLPIHF